MLVTNFSNVTTITKFCLLPQYSFKPRGGSVHKVTIYPSDFGLEHLAREEIEGPSELVHSDEEREKSSTEGHGYSMEKLRCYQLNQLK